MPGVALFGPRCWRCGMRRVGARRFCPACGADVARPEPRSGSAGASGPEAAKADRRPGSSPGRASQARPVADNRLRPTVWHARPIIGARPETPDAPAGGAGAASAGGLAALLGSLDAPTRRKLARLAGEVLLLTAVVAVVYGGPAIRGGARTPTATPAPTPTARVATLGLATNEVTMVFASGRLGAFEFSDEGIVDGAPLLTGIAGDGRMGLELWGSPADLRRVTLSLDLREPRRLDDEQQQALSAFLALYAPVALEGLLGELRTAFAEGREARRSLESGRISARLTVNAEGTGVAVVLLPARLDGVDAPSATPVPSRASPRPP